MLIKSLKSIVPSYPIMEESGQLVSIYSISESILGKVITVGYKGKIYNFQINTYSRNATPFQEEVGVYRFTFSTVGYFHIQQLELVRKSIEKFIYEKGISEGDIYE